MFPEDIWALPLLGEPTRMCVLVNSRKCTKGKGAPKDPSHPCNLQASHPRALCQIKDSSEVWIRGLSSLTCGNSCPAIEAKNQSWPHPQTAKSKATKSQKGSFFTDTRPLNLQTAKAVLNPFSTPLFFVTSRPYRPLISIKGSSKKLVPKSLALNS